MGTQRRQNSLGVEGKTLPQGTDISVVSDRLHQPTGRHRREVFQTEGQHEPKRGIYIK